MPSIDDILDDFLRYKGKDRPTAISNCAEESLKLSNIGGLAKKILGKLGSEDYKIRINCFDLINYLFEQSESFRYQICAQFTLLVDTCISVTSEKRIRRKSNFNILKNHATKIIIEWYIKFGPEIRETSIIFDVVMKLGGQEASKYYQGRLAEMSDEKSKEAINEFLATKNQIEKDIRISELCFEYFVPKKIQTSSNSLPQNKSDNQDINITVSLRVSVKVCDGNEKYVKYLRTAIYRLKTIHLPYMEGLIKCPDIKEYSQKRSIKLLTQKIKQLISQHDSLVFSDQNQQEIPEEHEESFYLYEINEEEILNDRLLCDKLFSKHYFILTRPIL